MSRLDGLHAHTFTIFTLYVRYVFVPRISVSCSWIEVRLAWLSVLTRYETCVRTLCSQHPNYQRRKDKTVTHLR
jgi:hypothetical protein